MGEIMTLTAEDNLDGARGFADLAISGNGDRRSVSMDCLDVLLRERSG